MLTGYTARPHFLKKVTYLVLKHDDRIRFIERLIAFHFGSRYLVEVHIVLPADMTVRQSHDIGQGLQLKIERLPEVERAFIHIDYECECPNRGRHKPIEDSAVTKDEVIGTETSQFQESDKVGKVCTYSSVEKMLNNFDICSFIGVIIVVHNTGV
jgi:hypothetical protein